MRSKQQPRPSYRWINDREENAEGEDIVNINERRDVQKAEAQSTGSASPSSTNSQDVPEVQTTTTSSLIKTKATIHRSKDVRNRLAAAHSLLLSRRQSNDSNHDDMEQNIPVTLIDHETGLKREMASPRCQSRDSSSGGRCPSEESLYSGRGISGQSGLSSELALSLPTSLPPGAAALLPPQAMAAYLNAAAVAAAQQNRLMLSSNLHRERSISPNDNDEPILDFSKKRKSSYDQSDSNDENLSENEGTAKEGTPLDLSVSRKRGGSDSPRHKNSKIPRPGQDFKPSIVSPWSSSVASQLPFFAAAAGFSPKALAAEWNGRNKMHSLPSDATKALEKMSELSRIGEDIFRASNTNSSHVGGGSGNSGSNSSSVSVGATTGRHSAWQSHWLNKGADTAKDVLKCVWCKQSFPTLEAMTTHMKETKHCGVNVPPHTSSQQNQSSRDVRENAQNSHNSSKNDLNLLIKETMPLPRKLVRGQDVWLGKGAEQTRQILKCMWCGQSFRSLSEMTQHMQETQHYTNIISQEQIISWKSGSSHSGQSNSGRGESNSNSTNNGRDVAELNVNEKSSSTPSPSLSNSAAMNNSHVSAVLTCKVCDQAFSSLKELSNHMVKNAHYKEHIMRSITESGSRRRQTKEKRKKSLPVRKLLELERAQNDFKNGDNILLSKPLKDISAGRITCEKCGDKIEMANFVDHIRQCIGSSLSPSQKLKSALLTNSIIPPDSVSPSVTPNTRDGHKSISEGDLTSPTTLNQRSPSNSLDMSNKSGKESSSSSKDKSSSSPSVLNAIEQLIEKSFDTKPRHSSANHSSVNHNSSSLGSSILKRLGIDENIDYTKPLVDAQTMNLLRTYHSQQVYLASSQFGQRERSGSESSSISERGSSRVDSLTPEKKVAPEDNNQDTSDTDEKVLKFKCEYSDEYDEKQGNETSSENVKIKREINDDEISDVNVRNISRESANRTNETDDDDDKPLRLIRSVKNESRGERESPMSPERRSSPASDRQSVKSNESSKKSMSSLGALSSMFDSLGSSEKALAENGSGKKGNRTKAHPLAALQKLCDKRGNENSPVTRSGSSSSLQSQTLSASLNSMQNNNRGSMLSFSWACNDGIVTEDSNIKCAFCDTTFSSKGSYRHHLSKVHFMCDDALAESIVSKSSSGGSGKNSTPSQRPPSHSSPTPPSKSPISVSPKSNMSADLNRADDLTSLKKSPSPVRNQSSNERHNKSDASATSTSSSTAAFDESPHSKFLKYTELAKQLSSKYV